MLLIIMKNTVKNIVHGLVINHLKELRVESALEAKS